MWSLFRYGGISIGGKLPVLRVTGKQIVHFLRDLGQMMDIRAVSRDCSWETDPSLTTSHDENLLEVSFQWITLGSLC